MRRLARWLTLWLALALWVAAPAPLIAQDTAAAEEDAAVNYADWEAMAERAETEVADRNTPTERLEELRLQLAQWRSALLEAQSANSARIATVRQQLEALGPLPAEGETEAEEISSRRQVLATQLVQLQAPGIAAEEAYRRANGLIAEIDRILRDRQADELLQVWPSPINPTNWLEAAIGLSDTVVRILDEVQTNWADPATRDEFYGNLPLVVILLVVALTLLIYIRRWVERFAERLLSGASARGRKIWSLLASTGMVILPAIGMVVLAIALLLTGLVGENGQILVNAIVDAGIMVFLAVWAASYVFPKTHDGGTGLQLPAERRAEGRFLALMLALVTGAEEIRAETMGPQAYSDATTAVMSFPILLTGGLILWRLGGLLRQTPQHADHSYAMRLVALLARGLTLIGIAGPVIAMLGYVPAGAALIYPAINTLLLLALLYILQRLIGDIWALLTKSDDVDRDGLVPVLISFAMMLASLPLFALIWGARWSDITELWTRFTEGFQLGGTRISPADFLVFAIVFVIGYTVTRLFQGGLRNTILPKTSMDQGGQTAVVAGVGYVGIFLAALLAINAAGIDLSGLAIVAGALSVGIGFGLQNIVSNFISGIILLIERPVSEGDWIEVGGVQGRVRSISVRSTRIETFDRNDVIVPNADLITGQVTNWTRFNLSGRLIVPVAVAQGSDTRKVERILREVAEAQPLAILNPPPLIVFMGYTTTQLNFEIRVILRDVNFSLSVRSDINHQVLERLAAEQILILPAPVPPAPPDPLLTAQTVLALADLVGKDSLQPRARAGMAKTPPDSAPLTSQRRPRPAKAAGKGSATPPQAGLKGADR